MSVLTVIGKIVVITALIKFSSGAVEDVLSGVMNGVAVNAAHAQMKQIHSKLMEYYSANGRYPRSGSELGTYLKNEFDTPLERVITDPWKNYYIFLTRKVEILCCGPDKTQNTRDDIEFPYPENILKSGRF